jgi:hypothetical protein
MPVAVLYYLRDRIQNHGLAILACAAISNAVIFISYNPLQRAGPIFAKHDTPYLRSLLAKQASNPHRWLLELIPPGATLNGLGYYSICHTLIAPQLAFFRKFFPDMSPAEFNETFNRYAFVAIDPKIDHPKAIQNDVILVPPAPFE